MLSLAKWARQRAEREQSDESSSTYRQRQERLSAEPPSHSTIRFVEFPYPSVYRRTLEEALEKGRTTRGVTKAAQLLRKYLGNRTTDYVEFQPQGAIDALVDFIDRAKSRGIDVERLSQATENYKRLVRANIVTLPELRAALREYLPHRAERRGDDPVKVAERELIGKDLPGFFPTPRPVIERMLELAEVEEQQRVLEPSCGKGDIVDALKAASPNIRLFAIERNHTLAEVLAAKGHAVEFGDFLAHAGEYDRIVMNPPFETGQDITHIRHAFALLAPGGRLVAVISEGPFFRSDHQSAAFREWLADVGGETEQLPEDAFQGRDPFRQTGVRTRLLTITKEDDA